MKGPKRAEPLRIQEGTENFEYWLQRPYLTPDRASQIRECNVLLVPQENIPNYNQPAFSSETPAILEFLEQAGGQIRAGICIDEDRYREVLLHGILIVLGGFVVTSVVAPIFAQLAANYLQGRLKSSRKSDATVRFELTIVEDDGSARKISYDGPAELFATKILAAIPNKTAGVNATSPGVEQIGHDS